MASDNNDLFISHYFCSALHWRWPQSSLQASISGRLISPLPTVIPKPEAPYSWPLFVSLCIQGVVTAAPKTVAFWAGIVTQSRQRSKPCATAGSEGGLAEGRGLRGLRSRIRLCHRSPQGARGTRLPAIAVSGSPAAL